MIKNKTDGKANFLSGVVWERKVSESLKSIGFGYAVPSIPRSQRDKDKVDIVNENEEINGRLPYNFQCKARVNHIPYAKLLSTMPDDGNANIILHDKGAGTYAIMNAEDFYNLIQELDIYKSLFNPL